MPTFRLPPLTLSERRYVACLVWQAIYTAQEAGINAWEVHRALVRLNVLLAEAMEEDAGDAGLFGGAACC